MIRPRYGAGVWLVSTEGSSSCCSFQYQQLPFHEFDIFFKSLNLPELISSPS
jgi:hypothetical protein